ncbi:T9SS type A sorting domain-containing protein [Aureivirga sp. CE67]|uniref:T9SS type A sorting domain-containing protein n=1 Tax=Aureivirga sp. CE67 TaxID=1788983 RepID=UPI0018CB73A8|nr:T9SS type A sorting domain-containing protein [Aureivirga sp. CE67]
MKKRILSLLGLTVMLSSINIEAQHLLSDQEEILSIEGFDPNQLAVEGNMFYFTNIETAQDEDGDNSWVWVCDMNADNPSGTASFVADFSDEILDMKFERNNELFTSIFDQNKIRKVNVTTGELNDVLSVTYPKKINVIDEDLFYSHNDNKISKYNVDAQSNELFLDSDADPAPVYQDILKVGDFYYVNEFHNKKIIKLEVTDSGIVETLLFQGTEPITGLQYYSNRIYFLEGTKIKSYDLNTSEVDILLNDPSIIQVNDMIIEDNNLYFSVFMNQKVYKITLEELTYVPDDNFEQHLINLNLDTVLDNYVLTDNISNIEILNIQNKNITSMVGIEDFSSLKELNVKKNNISEIDVTQNGLLEKLYLSENNISSIDITNNSNLKEFFIDDNQINEINLSSNLSLEIVSVRKNNLNHIDFSNNTQLTDISVSTNNIESIDISMLTFLEYANLRSNSFTSIDFTNNLLLEKIYLKENKMNSLDFSQHLKINLLELDENELENLNIKNGKNTDIVTFSTTNNPNLTCIQVDDTSYSTINWTNIDDTTSFSEDCSTLNIGDENFDSFKIYPNPANNYLIIDAINEMETIQVFDSLGRMVYNEIINNKSIKLDTRNYTSGVYFAKISINNKVRRLKFIIE